MHVYIIYMMTTTSRYLLKRLPVTPSLPQFVSFDKLRLAPPPLLFQLEGQVPENLVFTKLRESLRDGIPCGFIWNGTYGSGLELYSKIAKWQRNKSPSKDRGVKTDRLN